MRSLEGFQIEIRKCMIQCSYPKSSRYISIRIFKFNLPMYRLSAHSIIFMYRWSNHPIVSMYRLSDHIICQYINCQTISFVNIQIVEPSHCLVYRLLDHIIIHVQIAGSCHLSLYRLLDHSILCEYRLSDHYITSECTVFSFSILMPCECF